MRIAIDGRTIARRRTGVGVYADRLVRGLLTVDQTNSYTLFLAEDDPSLEASNLVKIILPTSTRFGSNRLWENATLPQYLEDHDIDVYFSPAYVLPVLKKSRGRGRLQLKPRMIATVHDLVSYHYPETFTLKMRLWQRIFVSNAVRVADCILADSIATKTDIHRFYDIPQELVKVLHLPVDDTLRRVEDQETLSRVRATYSLPLKFILYVGTLEPRKNVGRLAAAYARLPEQLRNEYSLVLVGRPGWHYEEIEREIDDLQLGGKLIRLGFVNQSDLPVLYSLASVFAYLSLYEGFGAPPLEAMACGTPVLSSGSSSLPEVVGTAGILVDPLKIGSISDQLRLMLTDTELQKRLSQAGPRQAEKFQRADIARQLLRVFEDVCAGGYIGTKR
jgi:glycosyltransferase involved in cell wall biosynthesis